MLYNCLEFIANRLSEYLNIHYRLSENMVEVGSFGISSGKDVPNKLLLTLLNIEKESGITESVNYQSHASGNVAKKSMPWSFNLSFIMSAVFEEKRYGEALQLLASAIGFLQQNKTFNLSGTEKIIIEPVMVNIQELNNIWGMMGGHHHPAFLGKIRMITFDGNQISKLVPRINKPEKKVD